MNLNLPGLALKDLISLRNLGDRGEIYTCIRDMLRSWKLHAVVSPHGIISDEPGKAVRLDVFKDEK